jgi:hypothetical protein
VSGRPGVEFACGVKPKSFGVGPHSNGSMASILLLDKPSDVKRNIAERHSPGLVCGHWSKAFDIRRRYQITRECAAHRYALEFREVSSEIGVRSQTAVYKCRHGEAVNGGAGLKLAFFSVFGWHVFSPSFPGPSHWFLWGVDTWNLFSLATTACVGVARTLQLPRTCTDTLAWGSYG